MRERIGPYRIESVIAEGGMGLVYKGRHDTLGRCAAIKTLLPKNALDVMARERFVREARAQALIAHENVVTVYDFIPEDGELFIAMEYVNGETLAALLQRSANGRMHAGDALPLMVQVLSALEHAHGRKIIHRDVKPSNVLVCNGLIKLTDFGIALMPDAPRLTAHEHRIGTREYMSPEQLQGGDVDHRTDVYSSGIVLYTMLAGRTPFPSRDILPAISERMAGPPDLRRMHADLPVGVWEALCIALQMEPERRFRTAAAFAGALRDISAGFLHPAANPEEEIPTEVLHAGPAVAPESVASPAAPSRRPLVPWIIIAGSLAASGYVLVHHTARFPAAAPIVTGARVVPILPPVELTTTVVTTTRAPDPQRPPPTTTAESVIPIDDGRAQREAEEKQRQEIATLRQELQSVIDRTEAALRAEQFDGAVEELESAAQKAQSYPTDFWQEREALTRLRTAIVDARVAARVDAATRVQQEALWAKRLADVEEDLRLERWPEAERFAKQIAEDPHAPPVVAERARTLLQKAKEGRIAEFKQIQLGPTKNTIRKPSTPPRKND